jgi:uncharacterized protein (DUF342 family)
MKIGRMILCLMTALSVGMATPLWADSEAVAGRQYQSVTEELMVMLKETMNLIKNLDHAPTVEEKRQLTQMMQRLDAMLKQQQEAMENMRDQLDSIRRQQDEFFQRQHTLERQQNLPR